MNHTPTCYHGDGRAFMVSYIAAARRLHGKSSDALPSLSSMTKSTPRDLTEHGVVWCDHDVQQFKFFLSMYWSNYQIIYLMSSSALIAYHTCSEYYSLRVCAWNHGQWFTQPLIREWENELTLESCHDTPATCHTARRTKVNSPNLS